MRRAAGSGLTAAIILVAMLTGASAAAAKSHAARGPTRARHARTEDQEREATGPRRYGRQPQLVGLRSDAEQRWHHRSVVDVHRADRGAVPPGFAATWTGIGGYSTSDLIQAGTSEDSTPSNPLLGDQYYAWYELLPASETQLTGCTGDANCTVTPGDNITVNISQVSGDTWSIAMTDAGKWSWSQDVNYSSSESSGEWILEAPTLVAQTTLADVGTAHFGPTSTYTAGGITHTIAEGDPTQIDLSPGSGQRGHAVRARLRRTVVQRLRLRADLRRAVDVFGS